MPLVRNRSTTQRRAVCTALPWILVLLTACQLIPPPTTPAGPSAIPTPPGKTPSSQPSWSPSPSPSAPYAATPPVPTWSPVHVPTPSSAPTATPPWPTALPTPTAAPPLYPNRQIATFFFFWYNCPEGNCDTAQAYAIPPGWTEPYPQDPNARDGLHYSSLNQYWYVQELRDMRLAGIDIVLPVSWGDTPIPWFHTAVLRELVAANRLLDPPLRIGLFDDTTSEASEYRDFADNGQFDGSTYLGQEPYLDLHDPIAGFLFYDRKIKPFFETIPPEMWATHNGRPVEEGGRPLIVAYDRGRIIHLDRAGALWTSIKDAFQRDFRDRNGQPIVPWIILETSWFSAEALAAEPSIEQVADGRYTWTTAVNGPRWHTTLLRNYTVASAGPGFDNRLANWAETKIVQERDRTLDGQMGGPGTFLHWSLRQIPDITDLLLIETWNELWEGSNVCRASYPNIAGQPVREDYYIDLLRQLLRGQSLWWAAQPLSPSWPVLLAMGQTYQLQFPVYNSGTRTWSQIGGERLLLGGDLFPEGYELQPDKPVRPGDVGQFAIHINVPREPGSYTVTWQMAGPEGPFGAPAAWTIQVGSLGVTPILQVHAPTTPIQVGQQMSLTTELDPPVPLAEVRLRVRFDPAFVALTGLQPVPGLPLRHWRAEVDNEQGLASLEAGLEPAGPTRRLVQLHFRALAPGQGGIWIEQAELYLEDGAALILPAQWVPLTVETAP